EDFARGQHAVHVQDQQLDGRTALLQGAHPGALIPAHATRVSASTSSADNRPIRSVMSSKPIGTPAGSTMGSSLILWRRKISSASATRVPWAAVSGFVVMTSRIG